MTVHPPPVHRSAEEQAVLEEAMTTSFAGIPFHQLLGLRIISQSATRSQVEVRTRPELIGNVLHYRLHGGAIATVIDAAAGYSICAAMAEKFCDENMEQLAHRYARIGTIDMRIDYLHQAQGQRFIATGEVLRLGGRIATAHVRFENEDGQLIATGAAAYIVS